MAIESDLQKFRLELGDLDADHLLFTDDQANYYLGLYPSSVLLAVAAACDALAARFAADVDEAEDGQSFKNSQAAAMYLKMAERFRKRAVDETVAAEDDAGLPAGRVPSRVPTSWGERY
jgi:Xaa-Pro aminopeptidase